MQAPSGRFLVLISRRDGAQGVPSMASYWCCSVMVGSSRSAKKHHPPSSGEVLGLVLDLRSRTPPGSS